MSDNGHIVIIGASDLVLPAYRIAREELDLGTIAVDWNADAPGMKLADIPLQVSTKDPAGVVEAVRNLPDNVNVKGIFTCGADVEVTVAETARALGLPGIDPEVARRCNDKLLMHRHLDTVGFSGRAGYRVVQSPAEAAEAAEAIGYPVVVKPLGNCGSRGVQRIESAEEMADAFQLAVDFNLERGTEILVEECLDGTKHTVEMMTWQGDWHLVSICDTHYISPRWPCETGLNITRLPREEQERIFAFSEEAARAIGIDSNAHKVDVNIASDGAIKMIELTARLSGGFHCQYASPLAYGTHEIRAAMRLAVGGPLVTEDITHAFERSAAVQAIFPEPGIVTSISGTEEAKTSPGVAEVFVNVEPGDQVGPFLNSTDRIAFVIAGGADADEASANAKSGASKVLIKTEPARPH